MIKVIYCSKSINAFNHKTQKKNVSFIDSELESQWSAIVQEVVYDSGWQLETLPQKRKMAGD